ncbi:MAG: hypothetical protein E7177_04170 [Erysipelotrichaceae bacterium]|nr:hypothetical protein [Erysipelotrichaceae bacterium]
MKLKIEKCDQLCQPDPFIVKDNDDFYIFTTGVDGVHCYYSNELHGTYKHFGIVFSLKEYKEYWAPAVIKIDDTYYLYVSFMPKNSTDVHEQRLTVATSKNILGPYEYVRDLTSPFSIDAHPVLNESGLYLFYSINDYESELAGTRIVVDKMISPMELQGKPKVVVEPSIEQEIFMKNRFKEGQDWYTIEGACYFYENGIHYLMYSANCYENEYYFVGYSVSNSKEKDLTKISYNKYPSSKGYSPLLSKNEFESGTGHNSIIKYKNEWYVIYHGRDIEDESVPYDNRNMRIGKLIIKGNTLKVVRD